LGYNGRGQLGDGSAWKENPVQVININVKTGETIMLNSSSPSNNEPLDNQPSSRNGKLLESATRISSADKRHLITNETLNKAMFSKEKVRTPRPLLSEHNIILDERSLEIMHMLLTPEAWDKTLTWSISDKNVATVINGKLTAVGKGTATLTITAPDKGLIDTCIVTVK